MITHIIEKKPFSVISIKFSALCFSLKIISKDKYNLHSTEICKPRLILCTRKVHTFVQICASKPRLSIHLTGEHIKMLIKQYHYDTGVRRTQQNKKVSIKRATLSGSLKLPVQLRACSCV